MKCCILDPWEQNTVCDKIISTQDLLEFFYLSKASQLKEIDLLITFLQRDLYLTQVVTSCPATAVLRHRF